MKLLEMLQNKGEGKEEEARVHQHMQMVAQKQLDDMRVEVSRREQEIMQMATKMKTLEEQHQDYQKHIAVLKESLCTKEEHYTMLQTDVDKLRQKNKLIEKKTQEALLSTQEKNRVSSDMNELRDHLDIKDRKISVLQRKIENLEDLLKEKDNQVDLAKSKLSQVQSQSNSSEGALSSLEEALADRDKQNNQLREQRDRAEKELKEEKELHERELAEYKMKIHSYESEVEKLQVRLDKSYAEKDKLEAKLEYSQSELGKLKAELDKTSSDQNFKYNDYNDGRQKITKLELEIERLRQENDRVHIELERSRDLGYQRL